MSLNNNQRQKLTVIIPCYNEEKNIEACLQSVMWAEEILAVDSFSTDQTLDILCKYTDRILQHEYVNSAAQKNWAIPQAKHEWVLIVDSDERVAPALRDEIQELLKRGSDKDGYWINRNNYLMGKRVKYSGWGRDSVLRLFRRDLGRYKVKRVHAEIELENTGMLTAKLEHHTAPSLASWIAKIDRYTSWKAQDKFEKGIAAPVLHLLLRPPCRFFKDFVLRLGILDGWRGFLIAGMSSFAELIMAAKLTQMTIEKRRSR
jgi:glycosyltransferase involved in cell wall biosynthesis